MTAAQRIAAARQAAVDRQHGTCARCNQPLNDNVHLNRVKSYDGATSDFVATHVTCEAPRPENNGTNSAACPHCGAKPEQPCITASGKPTRTHRARQSA